MTELTKTKYKFGILVGFTYNIAYQIGFENSTGNTIHGAIFFKFEPLKNRIVSKSGGS